MIDFGVVRGGGHVVAESLEGEEGSGLIVVVVLGGAERTGELVAFRVGPAVSIFCWCRFCAETARGVGTVRLWIGRELNQPDTRPMICAS